MPIWKKKEGKIPLMYWMNEPNKWTFLFVIREFVFITDLKPITTIILSMLGMEITWILSALIIRMEDKLSVLKDTTSIR